MTDWHKRFMELAEYIAKWSKYPGRKVGSVIVDDRHNLVSIGYNGCPHGCIDDDPEKYKKNTKYLFNEHAERNCIYNARGSVIDCIIYVPWFPCADCARAIIQSGIKRLVARRPNFDDPDWGLQFKVSLQMLEETGVDIVWYEEGSNPVKPEGWE